MHIWCSFVMTFIYFQHDWGRDKRKTSQSRQSCLESDEPSRRPAKAWSDLIFDLPILNILTKEILLMMIFDNYNNDDDDDWEKHKKTFRPPPHYHHHHHPHNHHHHNHHHHQNQQQPKMSQFLFVWSILNVLQKGPSPNKNWDFSRPAESQSLEVLGMVWFVRPQKLLGLPEQLIFAQQSYWKG